MRKWILSVIVTVIATATALFTTTKAQMPTAQPDGSFYDLQTTSLTGKPAPLSAYKGKVTLVVNTASKCGYTPQYAGLQKLHDEMKDKGFSVLGFPSNDFGGQEPGAAEEIATFCQRNYGVTFPMFSKLVTKAGPEQSPIYTYLGGTGHLPAWNFSKYVIGKDGRVRAFFPSKVAPDDPVLRKAIAEALAS
ncbi:MAG TPA: glutathione peroxidase [Luteitalea sp.]|nr:glutathione peroxidase [Luteitalea sp.]